MRFNIFSKKGIFFTFLSILFSSMFIIMAARETSVINLAPASASLSVLSANTLIRSIDSTYLPVIAKISGTSAILAVICEENATKKFVQNLTVNLVSLTTNGTFSAWASSSGCAQKIMGNNSMNTSIHILQAVIKDNFNMELNVTLTGVRYYQDEPWRVSIDYNTTISLKGAGASWFKNTSFKSQIPIAGMNEPLAMVYASYKNTIVGREKMITSVSGAEFMDHLVNMTYYQNPSAPSYLMRLQSNASASVCCGISTLVNPLKVNWPSNNNQSFVDHLYYTRKYENCSSGSLFDITSISGTYTGFKLDYQHSFSYNLTSKATQLC